MYILASVDLSGVWSPEGLQALQCRLVWPVAIADATCLL